MSPILYGRKNMSAIVLRLVEEETEFWKGCRSLTVSLKNPFRAIFFRKNPL